MLAAHQPVTLAAMEGMFATQRGAPIALIGQPDLQNRRLDNPLEVPRALSFLTYRRWMSESKRFGRVPAAGLARQYSAAVLQLPYYGGARHRLHPPSWWRRRGSCDAVPFMIRGVCSGRSCSRFRFLTCQHGRLDDRGIRSPAVADLRAHAHASRNLAAGVLGQRFGSR